MKKLTVESIEKKLKAVARAKDVERARWVKDSGREYPPISYRNALALPWQTRNKQFKSSTGKAIFDPINMAAYSYGWWKFVTRIKGRVVFNAHHYSMTTCRHQSDVRSVLESLGVKIDLEVNTRDSLESFWPDQMLAAAYKKLFDLEIASKRRNAKDRSKEIRQAKRDIKVAREIGGKCPRARMMEIKKACLDAESKRLAELAAERKAKSEIDKAARAMIKANVVADLSALYAA